MHSLSSRKAFMRFLSSILSGWWERSYVHWSQVHTCLVHVIKSQNITSYQLLVFWRSVRLDKKIEAVHVHVQCTTLAHVSFFSRFVLFVPGGRCSYSSNTQNQIPYYHAHINHCFSRSSLFIFYVQCILQFLLFHSPTLMSAFKMPSRPVFSGWKMIVRLSSHPHRDLLSDNKSCTCVCLCMNCFTYYFDVRWRLSLPLQSCILDQSRYYVFNAFAVEDCRCQSLQYRVS
jgi:hypothetical protein